MAAHRKARSSQESPAISLLEPSSDLPAVPSKVCTHRASPSDPPCGSPTIGRGLCAKHYAVLRRLEMKQARTLTAADSRSKEAKAYLSAVALDAAKLTLAGARVAARKGDTKPAEWILLHSRAIEPIAKDAGESGPRVTVNVGVALPGLGSQLTVTTSEDTKS